MIALLRALAVVVGSWFVWRLLGPEIPIDHGSPQERPLRIPGHTVIVGEREFFYRTAGPADAHPIVLIHGWSLDGEQTFYRLLPALVDRFRIIVPDLRNHGKSDWIRGRFDVADMAEEIAGVLDALDVRNATVLGYSLGGMVAQELARRRPGIVGSLVLGATAARPVPVYKVAAHASFWLGRAVARITTTEAARLTTEIVARSGGLERRHRRWFYEALRRRDATLFYAAGAAAVRFDSRPWVKTLGIPITVVIPSHDQLVRVKQQQELAELVGADAVYIESGGHEAILSHAEVFVAVLEEVVKETAV